MTLIHADEVKVGDAIRTNRIDRPARHVLAILNVGAGTLTRELCFLLDDRSLTWARPGEIVEVVE